jgi:hypothetical protein
MTAWSVVSIEGRNAKRIRSWRTKALHVSQAGSPAARPSSTAARSTGIKIGRDIASIHPGAARLHPHHAIALQRDVATRSLNDKRVSSEARRESVQVLHVGIFEIGHVVFALVPMRRSVRSGRYVLARLSVRLGLIILHAIAAERSGGFADLGLAQQYRPADR